MNDSSTSYLIQIRTTTRLADRLLSIYSLILILIGTPCNLLCCLIYFQKANRSNSIKAIFGYLAFLDTIVLYTFNLNYVVREFTIDFQLSSYNPDNSTTQSSYNNYDNDPINIIFIKKNLEEYSLFICRFLSYLAFSTLQTSSWVLAFGSLNRYLLVKNFTHLQFICKRSYTITICIFLTCAFFLSNMHILWMNGYRSPAGNVICYKNQFYPTYLLWYQRVHLCIYSALPSIILFILNTLLMSIIFASKKRLHNHKRVVLFAVTSTTIGSSRRENFTSNDRSISSYRKSKRNNPRRTLNRHSRKLTLSLIFITLSYFILTFPSTVIFSFFRSYIEPISLRRTLSLLFTNLSTTTHVIRFFIYFFCSIDFRNDFYSLCSFKRTLRSQFTRKKHQHELQLQRADRRLDSIIIPDKNELEVNNER